MRSRKAAGAGCSPPPCRTGVSAAGLRVALILTRYGLRVLDTLKLRRWSRPACVTTATGWNVTRWSSDRRGQPLIAGQQRPVAGTGREGVPMLSPSPGPARSAESRSAPTAVPSSSAARMRIPRVAVAPSRAFPRT
jgi:hypothetical protein